MAHKYSISASPIDFAGSFQGMVQLSDGTLAFIYENPASPFAPVLAHSPDGTTINTIATLATTNGFRTGTEIQEIALCRDNLDNLYVFGIDSAAAANMRCQAFTKGSGYSWTAQTTLTGVANLAGLKTIGGAAWCNTGGGTNSKGHILVIGSEASGPPRLWYNVIDAGVLLAGSGTQKVSGAQNPTFLGSPTGSAAALPMDISADGFGASTGLTVCSSNEASTFLHNVGRWAINSSGTLTTSTKLGVTTATGSLTATNYLPSSSMAKVRIIRYASDRWAIVYHRASDNNIVCEVWSSSGNVTTGAVPAAATNWPTAFSNYKWDAYVDPSTGKVWVLAFSTATANTVLRRGVTLPSVTWDAAATVSDTGVGTTPNHLRSVKEPVAVAGLLQYQIYDSTGSSIRGDNDQLNVAPNAPTLTAPANASVQDLAAGFTFSWTFSDPNPSDTQSAYALRRKIAGAGSYEYWNASTGAWQSTEVFNTTASGSVTFAAGKWSNGVTYNWSVATKDAVGFTGPYASDLTVTGSGAPSVTVTAPTGSVTTTSRPIVTWTLTDPDGDPQQTYQVKIFTAAQYGIGGFDPASSPNTWDSGEVSDVTTRSRQVGTDLANTTTFRAYVRIKANGQYSPWSFSGFSLTLTTPGAPNLTATADVANARVALAVTGTHTTAAFPITTFIVEYSDDGGVTWIQLRNGSVAGNGTPGATPVTVYDYEAPPNTLRRYRARTVAEV